ADRTYAFCARVFPIVPAFGFPVTVYLTTYYAELECPVYDAMASYLLWKGRGRVLRWPEVLGRLGGIALTDDGRRLAGERLHRFPLEHELSGRDKDTLLAGLAARLDVDYEEILRRRILQLMTLSEPRELAPRAVHPHLPTP